MGEFSSNEEKGQISNSEHVAERVVYVMPEHLGAPSADEIDLTELWRVILRGRWQIFAVTCLFVVASVTYAVFATKWYRAEVLLAPAEEKSMPAIGGQLGGLAALAGVSIGNGNSVEAVATLRSRDLARDFIEERGLLTVLLRDKWDNVEQRWREEDPNKQPDVRDAVRYFHENVLRVNEDRQTGLVTLAVEWIDPEAAANWVMALAERLNDRLRERALREAAVNVGFLREELAQTSLVTLQQAIGRLLESELQKLMLARGNEEFGFRVIDVAEVPKEPVRPRLVVVTVFGVILGCMVGVLVVMSHHLRLKHRAEGSNPRNS